jgi:hypothetical protein
LDQQTKSKIIEKALQRIFGLQGFDKLEFSLTANKSKIRILFRGNETFFFWVPCFWRKSVILSSEKGLFDELKNFNSFLGGGLKVKYFNIEVALHMDGTQIFLIE